MPSHSQVAHAWAHQTGKHCTGHNMFYEGTRIYSYGHHFLIARLIEHKGETVCLFTTRGYSVSTSQHKFIVRSAVRHLRTVYVNDPGGMPGQSDYDDRIKLAKDEADKAKRARTRADWALSSMHEHLRCAAELNELFDLGNTVPTPDQLGVAVADIEKRVADARTRQYELQFKRQTERREAWLAGGSDYFHGYADDGVSALLRVNGDVLETSLGADVPLSHAKRAFGSMLYCQRTGATWQRNGKSIHVGHFQIDKIEADGSFRAGCHTVQWSEVERIARQLGLITDDLPQRVTA